MLHYNKCNFSSLEDVSDELQQMGFFHLKRHANVALQSMGLFIICNMSVLRYSKWAFFFIRNNTFMLDYGNLWNFSSRQRVLSYNKWNCSFHSQHSPNQCHSKACSKKPSIPKSNKQTTRKHTSKQTSKQQTKTNN